MWEQREAFDFVRNPREQHVVKPLDAPLRGNLGPHILRERESNIQKRVNFKFAPYLNFPFREGVLNNSNTRQKPKPEDTSKNECGI
ncbi:hypothetical protein BCY86_01020 [Pajaroellobacter abortibovis]|uniref:Uncharacterized protein n=1 Tax=Pajaroellobacter abortibovis TaxID=1882918 RepID=A0A1L6MV76_9BACT|nr:hypothetical protein BCY86_01020 [Pajaroellobacter abortibovis]